MELMTDQRFRKTMKYLRAFLFISAFALIAMSILYGAILVYAKILGPPPLAVPQSTLYFSDDGKIIGESNNGQKRYWVTLDNISPDVVKATVAIEDKSYFEHNGLDYKRIAGAALADLKAMEKVQGASTITQQYARNLFLAHEKTWKRKLLEAFYAIRLEMNYSKNQILEGYLNTIYYGHRAYGIEAASQYYFGKSASDLTLGEASMLTGVPKGPAVYSPFVSMDKAKQRQSIILRTMAANGIITKEQAAEALAEKLTFIGKHPNSQVQTAPYFQDAVKNALKNQLQLDERTISLGGLKVFTTLNLKQQAAAEKQVKSAISSGSEMQVGLVAMNPKNGHVKALVGGKDYETSPFNRAVQAIRQPGSTIKPLLYYAALEQGFTPVTKMRSELTTFRSEDGHSVYTPHNFNNKYANGEVTLAQALAVSDNVYAVKTHMFLGEETLLQTAKKFGILTQMKKVPSLALGTSGVRVIEMANAYSLFANGGRKVSPTLITRVEDASGKIIWENENRALRTLKAEHAYVMTHMLTGVFDSKLNGYASVTGSTIINDMTRPYAGKSGSTETDSWMVGFAPQLVTAVWTGYDKGKPIHLTAEKMYAKNIWVNFMEEALKGKAIKGFKPPRQGVKGVYVNPANGKLASKDCPVKRLTYFAKGTEPTEYCTDHLNHKKHKGGSKKKTQPQKTWYKRILDWS